LANGIGEFILKIRCGMWALLALTVDAGLNWTFPTAITEVIGVGNFLSGGFLGANCVGNTCFAAGQYSDGTTFYPILAQTRDGGVTWSFPASVTNPRLMPSYSDLGYFYFPPPI